MNDTIKTNLLYWGDNLPILREFPSNSVDLIYLDPPFNSKRDYNLIFKDAAGVAPPAQVKAYSDTWKWYMAVEAYEEVIAGNGKVASLLSAMLESIGKNDVMAYLSMMAIRLIELKRVLKDKGGSIYVHCDPAASHYLKILMDSIFEPVNFRNEIIWRRTSAHGAQRSFGPIHDTILFYNKTDDYYFNVIRRPYMKGHIESRYSEDETGKYKFTSGGNVLTGAGATKGQSGQVWKGFNPSAKNRHWAIPKFLTDQMPAAFKKLGTIEKLDALYKKGLIEIKVGTQWPTPVRYLTEESGNPVQDIWAYQPYTEGMVYGTNEGIDKDVAWLGTTDPERTGYQTQKPLGVLKRIILSSCPEDGIVLDPFCGCGTTIVAAQQLNRKWIGIDITYWAIHRVLETMANKFGAIDILVEGRPVTIDEAFKLAEIDKFQFEQWAVGLFPGAKPTGGKPVDGIISFVDDEKMHQKKCIIEVTSGHNNKKHFDAFLKHVGEAEMGLYVVLNKPSKGMIADAKQMGIYHSYGLNTDFPKVQIVEINDIFEEKLPKIPPPYKKMGKKVSLSLL
jgi:site-specific DNA-methyltransferase (adenine-specific)